MQQLGSMQRELAAAHDDLAAQHQRYELVLYAQQDTQQRLTSMQAHLNASQTHTHTHTHKSALKVGEEMLGADVCSEMRGADVCSGAACIEAAWQGVSAEARRQQVAVVVKAGGMSRVSAHALQPVLSMTEAISQREEYGVQRIAPLEQALADAKSHCRSLQDGLRHHVHTSLHTSHMRALPSEEGNPLLSDQGQKRQRRSRLTRSAAAAAFAAHSHVFESPQATASHDHGKALVASASALVASASALVPSASALVPGASTDLPLPSASTDLPLPSAFSAFTDLPSVLAIASQDQDSRVAQVGHVSAAVARSVTLLEHKAGLAFQSGHTDAVAYWQTLSASKLAPYHRDQQRTAFQEPCARLERRAREVNGSHAMGSPFNTSHQMGSALHQSGFGTKELKLLDALHKMQVSLLKAEELRREAEMGKQELVSLIYCPFEWPLSEPLYLRQRPSGGTSVAHSHRCPRPSRFLPAFDVSSRMAHIIGAQMDVKWDRSISQHLVRF